MTFPVPTIRALLLSVGLVAGLALGFGASSGCNWLTPGGPKELRQGVVVRCNQPKATLYINERIVGTLSRPKGLRVGLPPGTYRMAVRLPGYFTRYLDLKVKKDAYRKVSGTERSRPEPPDQEQR